MVNITDVFKCKYWARHCAENIKCFLSGLLILKKSKTFGLFAVLNGKKNQCGLRLLDTTGYELSCYDNQHSSK